MAQQQRVRLHFRLSLTLVAGAVLGLQTGREVTIETVFELAFTPDGKLDEPFLATRLDQCKITHRRHG
jgi:hypothetical protein